MQFPCEGGLATYTACKDRLEIARSKYAGLCDVLQRILQVGRKVLKWDRKEARTWAFL